MLMLMEQCVTKHGVGTKFACLSSLGTCLLVYPTIFFPMRLAKKHEVSPQTLLALHSGVNPVAEQEPSDRPSYTYSNRWHNSDFHASSIYIYCRSYFRGKFQPARNIQ